MLNALRSPPTSHKYTPPSLHIQPAPVPDSSDKIIRTAVLRKTSEMKNKKLPAFSSLLTDWPTYTFKPTGGLKEPHASTFFPPTSASKRETERERKQGRRRQDCVHLSITSEVPAGVFVSSLKCPCMQTNTIFPRSLHNVTVNVAVLVKQLMVSVVTGLRNCKAKDWKPKLNKYNRIRTHQNGQQWKLKTVTYFSPSWYYHCSNQQTSTLIWGCVYPRSAEHHGECLHLSSWICPSVGLECVTVMYWPLSAAYWRAALWRWVTPLAPLCAACSPSSDWSAFPVWSAGPACLPPSCSAPASAALSDNHRNTSRHLLWKPFICHWVNWYTLR